MGLTEQKEMIHLVKWVCRVCGSPISQLVKLVSSAGQIAVLISLAYIICMHWQAGRRKPDSEPAGPGGGLAPAAGLPPEWGPVPLAVCHRVIRAGRPSGS